MHIIIKDSRVFIVIVQDTAKLFSSSCLWVRECVRRRGDGFHISGEEVVFHLCYLFILADAPALPA